jgi:phenylacetate-CoA ligase
LSVAWTVRHAYDNNPFFRKLLTDAGVDPGAVRGPQDLPRLPFTTKEQLREAYPFGWTCVPLDQVLRIHASTGTTGQRIVATYTGADLEDWADIFARCFRFAGVGPGDRVQVTPGYGLWTAGAGFQAGVERVGAMAVPTGPGNVDLQFQMMVDFKSTVVCATSSFGLLLAEEAQKRGLRDRLALRAGIFGSERWGQAMRSRIEHLLGIETYDIYGFTELYGPGTGIDCRLHEGIHYWDDYYVVEVVDPETGEPLPVGEEGEIVVTTLRKQAQPLIRYRTRDISRILPEPCLCGSPHPRIARLVGRADDMVKVRGVPLYPAMVDSVLAALAGLGSEYQVKIMREEGRERLLVRVEAASWPAPAQMAESAAEALRAALGIRPEIEVVEPGALPRSERKTQRIFDLRD